MKRADVLVLAAALEVFLAMPCLANESRGDSSDDQQPVHGTAASDDDARPSSTL